MRSIIQILSITSLLLLSITVRGQDINFDIHHTTIQQYIAFEDSLGSERIISKSNFVSFSGEAQPVIFRRKGMDGPIPEIGVYYYFKEADSTMSSISFEWDINSNEKQPVKVQEALRAKFNELEARIMKLYGQPEVEGDLSDLKQSKLKGGLKKTCTWKPNDSTKIELNVVISNYYAKEGNGTFYPTHRIRLYIRNTNKKKNDLSLDDNRIDSLNTLVKAFMDAIHSSDLGKVKSYVSDKIKEQVTSEQLEMLRTNLDFENELTLMYNGIQLGPDGKPYTMLMYVYKGENTEKSPPKSQIQVIFDGENKIIGFQPMVLQDQ